MDDEIIVTSTNSLYLFFFAPGGVVTYQIPKVLDKVVENVAVFTNDLGRK